MPNGRSLFSPKRERRSAVTVILTGQKVSSRLSSYQLQDRCQLQLDGAFTTTKA
jgi:hypothetical protein